MEDGTLSTYDATDNFTNSCMSRSGQSEKWKLSSLLNLVPMSAKQNI